MFGKLKEKLKSWVKKSTEEIEETAEKVGETIEDSEEIKEKPAEEKSEQEGKTSEEKEELEEELEETEKKDAKEILSEKPAEEVAEILEEKSSEKIKDVDERIEEVKEDEVEKLEEEIKEVDKESEEVKEDEVEKKIEELGENIKEGVDGEKPPLKFENAIKSYEPDVDKLKEKVEELKDKIRDEKAENLMDAIVEKKSFIKKLRSSLSYKITEKEFGDIFDELEMLLLENNVALEVTEDIKKILSEKLIGKEIKKEKLEEEIKKELETSLNEIIIDPDDPLDAIKEKKKMKKPFVILFFGINGTGKTTSIAKMTHLLKKNGFSVVLAAGDTFRAASIEQIQIHADKLGVPLIKQDYGADPSAVGFDAIKYAEKHKVDVVLIDTAGRMHTKTNLLAEMEKICRITDPDLKVFVAESIAGNDATEQAKTFNEMIEIDGSILSKADIDEKGGTIISVSHATHKPIFYLGVGQNYEDLELFDKQKYIEELGL